MQAGVYVKNRDTKLHNEDELPENLKGKESNENLSKSAAKNKKRREAAKKKKDDEITNAEANKAVNLQNKNEVQATGTYFLLN